MVVIGALLRQIEQQQDQVPISENTAKRYLKEIDFAGLSRLDHSNLFRKLSVNIGDSVYSLRATYYKSDYAGAGYLSLPAMQAGLDPHSTIFNLPNFGDAERKTVLFNRLPANGDAGWFATAYFENFGRSRAIQTSTTQHTFGYDERDILGARGGNTWTFGETGVLTVGAEVRSGQGDALRQQYRNFQPTANYANYQDLDLGTYGAFTQGQYRVLPIVKLHGGARYDRFDYEIVNSKLPASSTGYKGGVVTPKYGAIWNLRPDVKLYANIVQSFRSPAAGQISSSGSLGPLGNAGIDSSRMRSHDVGFNADRSTA